VIGLETGKQAENVALSHLREQGLILVKRNYRCRLGEIDLVMTQGDLLVFIEVRYRKSDRFGSGAETVDYHKRRKLILAAEHFLYLHHRYVNMGCRFDVISASPGTGSANDSGSTGMNIKWYRDAFQTD